MGPVAALKRVVSQFNIECLIGWLTIGLGLSIWRPNLSVPYYVLNEAGSARLWTVWLVVMGALTIASYKWFKVGGSAAAKRANIVTAVATFFTWGTITWLIKGNGPLGPTGFNGIVICAYLIFVILKYVVGDSVESG